MTRCPGSARAGWLGGQCSPSSPTTPHTGGLTPTRFHPASHRYQPDLTGITYRLPAAVSRRGAGSRGGSPAPPSSQWTSAFACTTNWEQLRDLGWAVDGSGSEPTACLWICS